MHAPALPLRTERLVLRAAVPSDLPALLGYYSDPEVARHLPHDVLVGDVMLRMTAGAPPVGGRDRVGLHPASAGRGVMTEAARAVVDPGFGHYGLHRIFAQLDARNSSSARLCERLGMTRGAHFRKDFQRLGEWTDSLHHGLLREECDLVGPADVGSPRG